MAYTDMDFGSRNLIDFKKIRSLRYNKTFTESTDNFTNGNEHQIFSQTFSYGAYLTAMQLYPSALYTTHTYDTSTFLHFCIGLEFNVYIDDELFQTIQLSHARSGTPSSTTTFRLEGTSVFYYYLFAEDIVVSTLVNETDPYITDINAFYSVTSYESKQNFLDIMKRNIRLCGITNGESWSHVGHAQGNHNVSIAHYWYGTVCPMIKINNNIRVTAKYLFFSNVSNFTNEAAFRSVTTTAVVDWIPIE